MIAFIRGVLLGRRPDTVVVDVGGVGYRLFIPLSTFYSLPEEGAQVGLHAVTGVREDAIHLYGFLTASEKELFEKLIGVSKIGPRTGLNILSGLPAGELRGAITRGDVATLSSIPGVGRKTAERIVLELQDKLLPGDEQPAGRLPAGTDPGESRVLDDVLAALVNLGYRKRDAEVALKAVWDGGERRVESLIRQSLGRLGPGRKG